MKIGIITMHRVLNCGSALQAYALQNSLEKEGYNVEIIDYLYPNEYHRSFNKISNWKRAVSALEKLVLHPIRTIRRIYYRRLRQKDFQNFYDSYYNLSEIRYNTKEALIDNPPKYEVYISGSDQIWNPRYVHEDTSFMLTFVHDVKKVAYSSSFSVNMIPDKYKGIYAKALNEYSSLALREHSGCDIVKQLINKNSINVLDPTLLLSHSEWDQIARNSEIHIDEPYLLVYVLGYSYNPYPFIIDFVHSVQERTRFKIVFLRFNESEIKKFKNYDVIRRIDPAIFLKLFSSAALVITDSFHGTAFSVNFNVPFYSIIPENGNVDNRIYSFLSELDALDRTIKLNSPIANLRINNDFSKINSNLERLRRVSLEYLYSSVKGQ